MHICSFSTRSCSQLTMFKAFTPCQSHSPQVAELQRAHAAELEEMRAQVRPYLLAYFSNGSCLLACSGGAVCCLLPRCKTEGHSRPRSNNSYHLLLYAQAAAAQKNATGSLSEQMEATLAAERAKFAREMEVSTSMLCCVCLC